MLCNGFVRVKNLNFPFSYVFSSNIKKSNGVMYAPGIVIR